MPKSNKFSDEQAAQFVEERGRMYYKRTDVVNSQLTYVGRAITQNQATDEAKWQIQRIAVSGSETIEELADDGKFTQIWDNRDSGIFPAVPFSNPASLLFDGVNEYIDLGDNFDFGPAVGFSWSWWFKANNFSAQRAMIAKTTQDANVFGYSFQHNSSGKLFTQFRASGTLRNHTFSSTMTAGVWTNIVMTYGGGSNMNSLTGYIDGAAEPVPSSASLNDWSAGHTDPAMIARRGTSFHFSGNMNQVAVWDKELSAAEVTEIYNSGTPGNLQSHSAAANLSSWWLLNTNANFPTETDQEGSINGTLINMESTDYDDGDVP